MINEFDKVFVLKEHNGMDIANNEHTVPAVYRYVDEVIGQLPESGRRETAPSSGEMEKDEDKKDAKPAAKDAKDAKAANNDSTLPPELGGPLPASLGQMLKEHNDIANNEHTVPAVYRYVDEHIDQLPESGRRATAPASLSQM